MTDVLKSTTVTMVGAKSCLFFIFLSRGRQTLPYGLT